MAEGPSHSIIWGPWLVDHPQYMISMDVWELSPIGPTGREKSPEECVQRLMGQC